MIVTANKYVNARVGQATTDAPSQFYKSPGDSIDVEDILVGTEIEGNSIWYKDKNDGCFYWSGSTENLLPEYLSDFGITTIWKETRGEGVKVFIIDSGFKNYDSLFIPEKNQLSVVPHSNATDQLGHGTLMSSIICSNSASELGIAQKAEIFSIKITDAVDSINENFLLQALNIVTSLLGNNDYGVVNLSLSLGVSTLSQHSLVRQKLETMLSINNLFVVSSVGNNGSTDLTKKAFPADVNNIISVAGLNTSPNYHRLSSSNYWNDISTAAPGDFSKTALKNIFPNLSIQGSSHGTAFISGVAVLVLSKAKMKNKNMRCSEFGSFLKRSSIQRNEVVDTNNYIYQSFDKNSFLNQFKTI